MGGGETGVQNFCGAMKYLRHILMDHEMFFKIFDGPRNTFLCSIFIILPHGFFRNFYQWQVS